VSCGTGRRVTITSKGRRSFSPEKKKSVGDYAPVRKKDHLLQGKKTQNFEFLRIGRGRNRIIAGAQWLERRRGYYFERQSISGKRRGRPHPVEKPHARLEGGSLMKKIPFGISKKGEKKKIGNLSLSVGAGKTPRQRKKKHQLFYSGKKTGTCVRERPAPAGPASQQWTRKKKNCLHTWKALWTPHMGHQEGRKRADFAVTEEGPIPRDRNEI